MEEFCIYIKSSINSSKMKSHEGQHINNEPHETIENFNYHGLEAPSKEGGKGAYYAFEDSMQWLGSHEMPF